VLTAGAVGDVLDRILGGVTDELITQSSDPLLIVRST
jgi:nucleotide-binding universal stress UspA family protein